MTPEQTSYYVEMILAAVGATFILYPALNTKKISNAVFALIGIMCLVATHFFPR